MQQGDQDRSEGGSPGTLGDLLCARGDEGRVSEQEWVDLVQSIAAGDQSALHRLYDRAHRPVFTLMVRMTESRETAEELTLDVFHEVWRRAARYDAADGTVLGWIMNQARSRAIDRLRFDQRKKRTTPQAGDPRQAPAAADSQELLVRKRQSATLRAALAVLTLDERRAIEAAFFSELTHVEVAERLNEPLGTIKTRIRSGLHKLRQVLSPGENKP